MQERAASKPKIVLGGRVNRHCEGGGVPGGKPAGDWCVKPRGVKANSRQAAFHYDWQGRRYTIHNPVNVLATDTADFGLGVTHYAYMK